MDMNQFRPPDLHVAQQSRRDKLRIHHDLIPAAHHQLGGVYINSLEQHDLPPHPQALNYEYCTEMLNFGGNRDDLMLDDKPTGINEAHRPFENFSPTAGDPHYCSTWKSIGSQSVTDNWVDDCQITNFVQDSSFKDSKTYQELHSLNSNTASLYQNAISSSTFPLDFTSIRHKSTQQTSHWGPATANLISRSPQALSLSLSSVPSPKVHATQIATATENSRDYLCGGSTHRSPGPLGPFIGYATILRGSKFLRPAQHLLDELCCFVVTDKIQEEAVSVSNKGVIDIVDLPCGGSSSLTFDGSPIGLNCSSTESYLPRNLQKKAKLLYMQDEVCKRYGHYQQQMQMVVSSFESVAGLSSATPYVSLALTMVSKHFRCLKNVIRDQLKGMRNVLDEDLSAPTIGSKSDHGVSMLRFFDQSSPKGAGGGFLDGQHIWRPQRGLPERAVSILRSWLFDHFLHPYPTDTDKHVLANQTGLTRNQVSNWFINARVRIWKPMVEEIHMLESKGMSQSGLETSNPSEREGESEHRVASAMTGLVPGAVSLTLGLRQSAENNALLQPKALPLHLRMHFGGKTMQTENKAT